jgi:hypothetical protein
MGALFQDRLAVWTSVVIYDSLSDSDTKTYWLIDRQSQRDFDFDFDLIRESEQWVSVRHSSQWKRRHS